MSIAYQDREAKERWLLRPFNLAGQTAFFTLLFAVCIWTDPKVTTIGDDFIIYLCFAGLAATACLTIWGIRRVMTVVRGI